MEVLKIHHIIPAHGWRAKLDDGTTVPVTNWAYVSVNDPRFSDTEKPWNTWFGLAIFEEGPELIEMLSNYKQYEPEPTTEETP